MGGRGSDGRQTTHTGATQHTAGDDELCAGDATTADRAEWRAIPAAPVGVSRRLQSHPAPTRHRDGHLRAATQPGRALRWHPDLRARLLRPGWAAGASRLAARRAIGRGRRRRRAPLARSRPPHRGAARIARPRPGFALVAGGLHSSSASSKSGRPSPWRPNE